jgi:glycerol-3-phosphate dehydrogenase (NAD(P)+)
MARKSNLKAARTPQKLVIIGPGRWGTALSKTFKHAFKKIVFLGRGNSKSDWKSAMSDKPLVIIATPFKAVPKLLPLLAKEDLFGVINTSKGIDPKTLQTFTQLAKKKLKLPFATLSGPTFAKELKQKKPSACVLAGTNKKFITALANQLSTPYFRIYTSDDPIGIDACGALKNVFAIACGISDGLKLGFNARAALLARSLNEMGRLVQLLGGKSKTVTGLAGVGDLWLTATGDLSRNRQFGLRLAKGEKAKYALSKLPGPSEGYNTIAQVHKIAKKKRVSVPICEQVYKLCKGTQDPKAALFELMTRELKSENSL